MTLIFLSFTVIYLNYPLTTLYYLMLHRNFDREDGAMNQASELIDRLADQGRITPREAQVLRDSEQAANDIIKSLQASLDRCLKNIGARQSAS